MMEYDTQNWKRGSLPDRVLSTFLRTLRQTGKDQEGLPVGDLG